MSRQNLLSTKPRKLPQYRNKKARTWRASSLGVEMPYLTLIKWLAPVVIVAAYTWAVHSQAVKSERERWETKAYQATIQSHEAAAKFTSGVLTAHNETEQYAQNEIDQLDHVVNNSIGLREQLDALQKRHSADRARSAEYSKTAQNTIRVLSRLLNESEHLAGIYAENADRNRIAGRACEKAYSDLKKHTTAYPR